MVDIYQAPTSNTTRNDELAEALAELIDEQSILGTCIAVPCGIIPSIMFISLFRYESLVPIIFMFVPGLVVGLLVKLVGRPFRIKLRLAAAFTTGLILFGFFALVNAPWLIYCMIPINMLAVVLLSRRPLTPTQEKALYLYELGKLVP